MKNSALTLAAASTRINTLRHELHQHTSHKHELEQLLGAVVSPRPSSQSVLSTTLGVTKELPRHFPSLKPTEPAKDKIYI